MSDPNRPDSPPPQERSPCAPGPTAALSRYITLIIKPFRLEPVLNALRPFHIDSLVVTEVRGYGRQKGHLELYSGAEYVISFIPKLKVEFTIPAEEASEVFRAVRQAARTGRIGDGKVFLQKVQGLFDEPI